LLKNRSQYVNPFFVFLIGMTLLMLSEIDFLWECAITSMMITPKWFSPLYALLNGLGSYVTCEILYHSPQIHILESWLVCSSKDFYMYRPWRRLFVVFALPTIHSRNWIHGLYIFSLLRLLESALWLKYLKFHTMFKFVEHNFDFFEQPLTSL